MKKIFTAFLLILSMNAFSQAEDPADGDGTVPVDGGISLLMAAGAAWSISRFKNRHSSKQ